MSGSEFDTVIDRRGTFCTQWDYIEDRFGTDNLLPFTISDMDIACPKSLVYTLKKRIEHPIYGYSRWIMTIYPQLFTGMRAAMTV